MQQPKPRGCCGNPGIASCVPQAKKVKRLATRDTLNGSRPNLRQREPDGRIVPTPPTFGTKVRARRDVPEGRKNITIILIHIIIVILIVIIVLFLLLFFFRVWGNPGSTRNLQLLLFLFFVAWRTRQVGARFDGEPSDGNDRSASRQREVLRGKQRVGSDYLSAGNVITRLSVVRIYGDSTTTLSTTRHDIQYLWDGYRSYKSSREDLST